MDHPPWMARVGEWLSLVEHLVRDQGVGGSNPLSPTIYFERLTAIWKKIKAEPLGLGPGALAFGCPLVQHVVLMAGCPTIYIID